MEIIVIGIKAKTNSHANIYFEYLLKPYALSKYKCSVIGRSSTNISAQTFKQTSFTPGTWQYFLQHLPTVDQPILDYRGSQIANRQNHVAVITYDFGKTDLQQCANALMRLQAEYFFEGKQYGEIGFHFTNNLYYSFSDYCKGVRPIANGAKLSKVAEPCAITQ